MNSALLVCTDLDGTLIPDGTAPESAGAREHFAELVSAPEVTLAYVTGRDPELTRDAIREFDLPLPDYAITDVGTRIFGPGGARPNAEWLPLEAWDTWVDEEWGGRDARALAPLFEDVRDLELQPPSRLSRRKLSFTVLALDDPSPLLRAVEERLAAHAIPARTVWSVDDSRASPTGLLDVIPQRTGKLAAVEFVRGQLGAAGRRLLFAGDSGNDLDVLIAPLPAVLVANASGAVRRRAVAGSSDHRRFLHLARPGELGMNGNYAAGILAGVAHFFPDAIPTTVRRVRRSTPSSDPDATVRGASSSPEGPSDSEPID